ncbi:lysozyme inhibitor LprI family protein [uncultured Herbaspirillum sp.]|uniref:lysozyme inhibitor LprI family protein n=1 Tax=uncultured Herbaspirillum sp. TaxID=160236 RepID=UPI00338EA058
MPSGELRLQLRQGGIQEIICGDQELSKLDGILDRTYKAVLKVSTTRNSLRIDQRQWLSRVRNRCKDVACLVEVYETRIFELESKWTQQKLLVNICTHLPHLVALKSTRQLQFKRPT